MIYVRDKGRMCNNILQFGHVYAFAREHGRRAVSMRFAYKYPWFHITHTPGHNFARYAMAKFAAARGWMPVVSYDTPGEVSAEKERIILDSRNVMVQGWEVRHYDLFLKYLDEIKALFRFEPKVEQAVEPLLAEAAPGSVRLGLHVRRGDYARWHGGRFLFTDEQYAAVAKSWARLHPKQPLTIYVCGNDPTLQRDVYRQALPEAKWIFPQGNPAEDLCLLSHCHELAGAPSTFSLVASMYADLPLYWIHNPQQSVGSSDFGRFADLFRHIL